MSATHLSRFVEQAAADARERRGRVPFAELRERVRDAPPARPFAARLLGAEGMPLIAEIKRRSPSKGDINPGLDPAALALAFERGGAACLSVLTDRAHFGGSLDDLAAARAASSLPILRKDFLVTSYQLHEARAFGADAVLLLAAAAPRYVLEELRYTARELGLSVLLEVHAEGELELVPLCRPDLLGVNARNLATLEVEPRTFGRLAPLARAFAPLVAESGVRTPDDVRRYRALGARALLVGEALSSAPDPEAATRALVTA